MTVRSRTIPTVTRRPTLGFRRCHAERLEHRICLDGAGFVPTDLAMATVALPNMILADIDGDQDLDLVGGGIVWRENTDGKGTFGPPITIASQDTRNRELLAADVDGDGDQDIVSATLDIGQRQLSWYENRNGRGRFGPERPIAPIASYSVSLRGGDFDGDGDFDLLIAERGEPGRITWYQNQDRGERFVAQDEILAELVNAEVYDLDQDGDLDIIANTTQWFENSDSQGTFVTREQLSEDHGISILIDDVDRNNQVDLLVARSSFGVTWLEAPSRTTNFQPRIFSPSQDHTILEMTSGDYDGDGDLDVAMMRFTPGVGVPFWQELTDAGHYERRDSFPFDGTILTGDLNADGKDDLVDHTVWRQYDDATGRLTIETEHATQAVSPQIELADMDGDNDLDIVAIEFSCFEDLCTSTLLWLENENGLGRFGRKHVITANHSSSPPRFFVTDVDMDGDGDVILGSRWSRFSSHAAVYKNIDGRGHFDAPRGVADEDSVLLHVADISGNGFPDLIRATANQLLWQENTGRDSPYGRPPVPIIDDIVESVTTGDWNEDGDLDIVAVRHDAVVWYEQVGANAFTPARELIARPDNRRTSVVTFAIEDLNQDGHLDLVRVLRTGPSVSPASFRYDIQMHLSMGHDRGFEEPIELDVPIDHVGTRRLQFVDIDDDGDQDLLALGDTSNDLFFEAIDGTGTFQRRHPFNVGSSPAFGDIDHDGDVDFITRRSLRGGWYEHRPLGDVDGDGLFTQLDLNQVALNGKYNDDVPGNATFADGDWNRDGEFDEQDIVAAFSAEHFAPAPT